MQPPEANRMLLTKALPLGVAFLGLPRLRRVKTRALYLYEGLFRLCLSNHSLEEIEYDSIS
jgi:hypothetical protein